MSIGINVVIKDLCPTAPNGKGVWIIGEGKTQLKKRDVDQFIKMVNRVREVLSGEVLPLMVVYQVSPQVRRYAEQRGIRIYFSYQFPL